jgi:hypothetical protein
VEDETADLAKPFSVACQRPHHLLYPLDVVVGGAEELENALDGILPEHPRAAPSDPGGDLGEALVGRGELAPEVGERDGRVEVVAQRGTGGGHRGRAGGVATAVVVEEECEAAVGKVGEREEVGPHGAGEAERGEGGAAPEESLAGGEGERKGEIGGRERERVPLILCLSEGETAAGCRGRVVVARASGFGGLYGRGPGRRRGGREVGRGRWKWRGSNSPASGGRHGSSGEGRPWRKREAHSTLREIEAKAYFRMKRHLVRQSDILLASNGNLLTFKS